LRFLTLGKEDLEAGKDLIGLLGLEEEEAIDLVESGDSDRREPLLSTWKLREGCLIMFFSSECGGGEGQRKRTREVC